MEEPTIPPPPPKANTRLLWTSLLIPPFITAASNIVIGCCGPGTYGANLLASLIIGAVAILACLFIWLAALRPRFRGRSLVLLGFAYPIAQVVICLTAWFGSCLPFVS